MSSYINITKIRKMDIFEYFLSCLNIFIAFCGYPT
nr:MAG TPA: hypothetical protein [Caudoviricetes sp.]